MVERACRPDGGKIGGIEAEEKYTRPAVVDHVRPDVELGKTRQSGQRGHGTPANSAHVEGHDSDPALTIERIKRELCWDNRTQGSRGKRPVGEKQIMPDLLHDPGPGRQWPRAMRHGSEQAMHDTS